MTDKEKYQVIVSFRTTEKPTPDGSGPKGAVDANGRTQTYVAAPGEGLVFAVPGQLETFSFTVDEVVSLCKAGRKDKSKEKV